VFSLDPGFQRSSEIDPLYRVVVFQRFLGQQLPSPQQQNRPARSLRDSIIASPLEHLTKRLNR
jgi:hypothetical protein